jgi:hypothetical protein
LDFDWHALDAKRQDVLMLAKGSGSWFSNPKEKTTSSTPSPNDLGGPKKPRR